MLKPENVSTTIMPSTIIDIYAMGTRWLLPLYATLFFFIAFCAMGQPAVPSGLPQRLSLEEATTIALQRNPSLTRLEEERQAAEARETEAASNFLPKLTLEAIDKDGPSSAPGFGFSGLVNSTIVNHYGASVVLGQMIYDFGRTLHLTRSRRLASRAAVADEQAQRAFVALNVVQQYTGVLLEKALVELAKENQAYWKLTVKEAQTKFDAGLTSRVDADLARANLAQAEVRLVNESGNLEKAFAGLSAVMGVESPDHYQIEEIPDNGIPALVPDIPEMEIVQAEKNRPEIQGIESQILSSNETARAAKAGGLPLVRGLASGGYDHITPGLTGINNTYAVGVGISFPFYTGGLVEAGVAEAEHNAKALEAARDELEQTIRLQVIQARLTLLSLAQSKQATGEELKAAEDSANLAAERYQEGLGNILEVQQSQLTLLAAKTDAIRLRYETITALAAYRYALGTLVPVPKENTRKANP